MSTPTDPYNADPYAKKPQDGYDAGTSYGQQQDYYGQNATSQQYGAPQGQAYPQEQYGQQYGGQADAYGQQPYQGLVPENKKALPALICSILGWFCGPLAVVGVVLGVLAQKEIKTSRGMQGGEGKAKAAVIIGAIAIIVNVVYGIYVFTQR